MRKMKKTKELKKKMEEENEARKGMDKTGTRRLIKGKRGMKW